MANIKITSTTNAIRVNYLDEADNYSQVLVPKALVDAIKRREDDSYVEVHTPFEDFLFSYVSSPPAKIVDTIDAVAPTSNADLFVKLTDLLG